MYIGQIRSIFPINYLASSLHIKTLSLLCLQWSSTHFNPHQCSSNFFAQCANKSVLFLLFGGWLREGLDSTYKRVLLHRIKHVTKSIRRRPVELYHHPCFCALNQTIYYRCQATHIFKFSNQRHWLDESTDVYSIDFFSFIVFYVGLSRFCCYLFYILFHPSSRFGVLYAFPFLCRDSAFINHFHWITC